MEKDIKSILSDNGFLFKKQFGQNFITDKNLLASIVTGADVNEQDTVVEIGCGAGTLTREIAKKVKKVVAFEIDKTLQPVLEETLKECDNVEVIFKDFLKVDITEFEKSVEKYTVIANLPYYVTTPLVMKLIEESEKCIGITVMVQEEVAERFCAVAGTAEYGGITAMIALRCKTKIIKKVPRTMFYPIPNVDSAVVKFTFDGALEVKDKGAYKKVVQAAFLSRRKTLENNLVNYFGLTRDRAKEILLSCSIPPQTRGETLTPQQFSKLSEYFI